MPIATVTDDIDGSSRTAPYDAGAHERSSFNTLTALTSGGGVGDLLLSLTLIHPSAVEGLTLISTSTLLPLGSGPLFGLWPDALLWTLLTTPIATGNPLHFPVGPMGVFPALPLVAPPGSLSAFAGQTWDLVAVVLGPSQSYLGQSNIVRVSW